MEVREPKISYCIFLLIQEAGYADLNSRNLISVSNLNSFANKIWNRATIMRKLQPLATMKVNLSKGSSIH